MLPGCRVASMLPGKLVRVANINPESRKLPAPFTKPDSPEMSCGRYSGKLKTAGYPDAGEPPETKEAKKDPENSKLPVARAPESRRMQKLQKKKLPGY